MLKYTGHPLVDVGVATIAAFAGKRDPAQLTEADLNKMADYITHEYTRQPLKSFLTVAFTSNAWFSQDAYNPDKPGLSAEEREKRRQKREKWAKHHLRQWSSGGDESDVEQDVFTGESAYQLSCPESCRRGGLDVLKCRSHWEMNTLTSTLMAFQDFLFQGQPSCPSKPSPSVAPNAVDACWPFTQTTTN